MFDLLSTAELTASSAIVVFFLSSLLSDTVRQRVWVGAALTAWFCLILAAGATGAFARPIGPGIPGVGLGVLIPIVVLSLLVLGTARGRELVRRVPMTALVGLHIVRVLGITFVLLYWAKRLPAPFAPVAGWGDILVGLLAIPLVLRMSRGAGEVPKGPILLWNVLGVADLVTAVTLAATIGTRAAAALPCRAEHRHHGQPAVDPDSLLPGALLYLCPPVHFLSTADAGAGGTE